MTSPNRTAEIIRRRIADAGGALPWAEVMRLALYEPDAGYYRRDVRRMGRGGDFYTSVSVGAAFGELLAVFIAQTWRALGQPVDFAVIEQGAHDGTLARDVFAALERNAPDVFAAARCVIIEPDEAHRAAQCATLEKYAGRLSHVHKETGHSCAVQKTAQECPVSQHAVFLCNELPDAFPVHRVQFAADGWREMFVRCDATGSFEFFSAPLSSPLLANELKNAPVDLPGGFITEINLAMLDWLRGIAAAPFTGAMLVLDYGFTTADQFAQERHDGTLRRYRNHQCDTRVLDDLGECDLTSQVNFTRLAQAAVEGGCEIADFIEQGRFLTRLFSENAMQNKKPEAAWLRQFQSLTHPGIMGRSFHALVLTKGMEAARLSTPEMQAAARRRLGL